MSTIYERFARSDGGPRHLAVARLKREILRALNVALRKSEITQSELASRLKVRKSAVSQVLHGDGNLRIKTLAEYLEALGYELDVRLVEAGEPRRALVEGREVAPAIPEESPKPSLRNAWAHESVQVIDLVAGGRILMGLRAVGTGHESMHFEGDATYVPSDPQRRRLPAPDQFQPVREVAR